MPCAPLSLPCNRTRLPSFAPADLNRLYAFLYALCEVKNEEIPDEYMNNSERDKGGAHLLYVPDILGTKDAIAYDGTRWRNVDLIPKERVCRVIPCVFKDKMMMWVIAGEYVDYLGKLSRKPKTLLYMFDGQRSEELSVQCDAIGDIVVKEDRLLQSITRRSSTSGQRTELFTNQTGRRNRSAMRRDRCQKQDRERFDERSVAGPDDGCLDGRRRRSG